MAGSSVPWLKQIAGRRRPVLMEPDMLVSLVVLLGVSGFVARGLLVTWYKLRREGTPDAERIRTLEQRVQNMESATSGLLVEMSSLREKQRFMGRLYESAAKREPPHTPAGAIEDSGVSPMMTQNIPIGRSRSKG